MGLYGVVLVREISDTLYHSATCVPQFQDKALDIGRTLYIHVLRPHSYGFTLFDVCVHIVTLRIFIFWINFIAYKCILS